MSFGLCVVGLDDGWLALPIHHLSFVEKVGVVDLLKVEL